MKQCIRTSQHQPLPEHTGNELCTVCNPKPEKNMSNVPCQECGTDFEYNDAPTDLPVCLPCVDKVAFTIYLTEYRPTLLDIAEGRLDRVEHIATVRWNKLLEDGFGYGHAVVEIARDTARSILRRHPRKQLFPVQKIETTVNPYAGLCPDAGETLSEYLERKGWPDGVMPFALPGIEVPPGMASRVAHDQPMVCCTPFLFLVERDFACDFDILNITQGHISCFAGVNPVPATMFQEPVIIDGRLSATPMRFRRMTPAERMSVTVRNKSAFNLTFRCCFFCKVDVNDY